MNSAISGGGGGISQTTADATYVAKAGSTSTGPQLLPAGSVGAPALAGSGDTNTGITFPGSDVLGLNAGGAEVAKIITTGLTLDGPAALTMGSGNVFLGTGIVSKTVSGGATAYDSVATGPSLTFNAGDGAIRLNIDMSGLSAPGTTVLTPPPVTATIVGGISTGTTVGAAGGASVLPAVPLGYLLINLPNGTQVKIPYYNT